MSSEPTIDRKLATRSTIGPVWVSARVIAQIRTLSEASAIGRNTTVGRELVNAIGPGWIPTCPRVATCTASSS